MAFLSIRLLNSEKHNVLDTEKRTLVKGPKGDMIKMPSLTQPGKCVPMNQLIKQLANGSITVDPSLFSFDFPSRLVDSNAHDSHGVQSDLVKNLDAMSDGYTDPTAAPNFEATDAEAILAEVGSQATDNADVEGGKAASNQTAQAAEKPDTEALSPSEPAPTEG